MAALEDSGANASKNIASIPLTGVDDKTKVESNSDHLLKCLEYLMRVRFPEEDTGFQSLAIQYLNAYVNSNSGDGSNSVMTMLCKQLFYITPDDFTEYRPVLKELLEYDNWIPRSNYTRSANPLNQILFGAQDRPQLTYSVKDMIECLFSEKIFVAPFDLLWSVEKPPEDHNLSYVRTNLQPMAWRRVLLHLFLRQITPFQKSPTYVYPHYYKLNMLNNPAIEALIQYKCDFVLVRDTRRRELVGVEEGPSFYNILDLLAFLIPMGASINQLINISQMDSRGSTLNLSFSIIIIFLHMLSELRVIQHVCKYVTIIIRVIVEIRVFFMVFALGILSFSLAIQHVIQGCPSKGGGDSNGCRKDLSTDFPYNFVEAISSTYFIMGGRYDSVSKEFSDSPNASLQAMMAIYLFFTVILMLNVLIGFRQSKNWFPREIYYTRTKAQVAEYEEKVLGKKQSDGYDGGVSSSKEQSDPTELQQLRTQVGDLVKQQAEYNANLEKMFADLIERLGKDK
ncbi:hypothetical protein BGZ59_009573 [Podila verticillata]|nr:hypothetical protein BGZ59_009573 [Podila verticillata]